MWGYLLSIRELLSGKDGCPEGEGLWTRSAASAEQAHREPALGFMGKTAGQGASSEREPTEGHGGRLLARAFDRVDVRRRERAAGMKPGRGQAACLGAGLLLQLALAEAMDAGEDFPDWKRYGAGGLLAHLESMPPIPVEYVYGRNGKPYLKDCPFYFSISHSGEYVLCVLSRQEIGADIQQHRKCGAGRLADRFFSERERAALGQAFRQHRGEEAFFRLWVRKEAYGKLTGGGIGDTVGRNLLPGEEELPEGKRLVWERVPETEGYSAAVCRYGNNVR